MYTVNLPDDLDSQSIVLLETALNSLSKAQFLSSSSFTLSETASRSALASLKALDAWYQNLRGKDTLLSDSTETELVEEESGGGSTAAAEWHHQNHHRHHDSGESFSAVWYKPHYQCTRSRDKKVSY